MKVVIDKPIRKNPDYMRWYRENRYEHTVLAQAKSRAKRLSLEFDLDVNDIVVPKICPVLNIPIKKNSVSGWHDDSPSLDRIDNNKGYVKDNIRVISNRANRLKCDATLKELELILIDARNIRS